MENIKEMFDIKKDGEIAELLGISFQNYSEKKRKNVIPYENLVILCKKHNLNANHLFKIKEKLEKKENFKILLENSIQELNEKESKYFYHLIESAKAKKEIYE